MADAPSDGTSISIDTASGPVDIAVGLPDWVTANLAEQAAMVATAPDGTPIAPDAQIAPPSAPSGSQGGPDVTASGHYVDTPGGVVYIPDNVPQWVVDNLIAQQTALAAPQIPQAPQIEPQPTTIPVPERLPAPGIPDRTGGLLGAARDVARVAIDKAQQAGAMIAGAAADIGSVVGRITDQVSGVIQSLLPTISELALGLTSRMADLAGFIGEKVVDVATFAKTMAVHSADALAVVFGDAWTWIRDALLSFVGLFAPPLRAVLDDMGSRALEPFL